MTKRSLFILLGLAALGLGILAACGKAPPPTSPISASPASPLFTPEITPADGRVEGMVLSAEGNPLAGATVRIQATSNATLTDAQGHFRLAGLAAGVPVTVSAWADGCYCSKVEAITPPVYDLTIRMRLVQTNDNPDYAWIPSSGENSCYSCKPGMTQVWLDNDAHGRSAVNPRYLSMYNGTDIYGNQSPLTRYITTKDYGQFPMLPDLSQPYYGPGYKLDYPATTGNCAACHNPGAALDSPYGTDPNAISGADLFGVHCDFCHKIADVILNPDTGLPYPNMPGVLSIGVRRPFLDDPQRYQLFFGTFDDDNVPEEDTYLPLLSESRYCAPCHSAEFWGVMIYNSYGEWLESPYSDLNSGKARTCQECHMPAPTLLDEAPITNVAPGKGGVERDPLTIHAHTFPGAANQALLQNAVTMTATGRIDAGRVVVEVSITNDLTGHSVPTDSPLRHLILLVQATDVLGNALHQIAGSTVPGWGGVGDPDQGYYAGLPGKAYARVLQENWTGISPSGSYWNPVRVVTDNRLAAFASDHSEYVFAAPEAGNANIQVNLLFRRAFIQLADWKGWEDPDIVMESVTIEIESPRR